MKYLLSLIIGGALVVSGFGQTRNVLVGTNNAVVQPTNFWSADAVNARSGLGLGTAATNPASAFQPSSLVLSNLASSNAVNLTNLRATNVVGTLSLTQGGTGATNAATARTNLGLDTAATNPASAFQPSSAVLSNLAAGNGANLTNIQASNLVGTITTNLGIQFASITATNGESIFEDLSVLDEINAAQATFGTNTNIVIIGSSGISFGLSSVAATTRTNLGLGLASSVAFSNLALSNGAATNLAVRLGSTNLGFYATAGPERIVTVVGGIDALQVFSNSVETATGIALSVSGAGSFGTNVQIGGPLSFSGTNAAGNATATRTNLGLGWPALTNSNAGTGLVSVNTNGEVVGPTNFWQVAPISTTVQNQTNVTATSTNAATNSRNLFLFSLAPTVSGVTNTVALPTNPATTFEGDRATITHLAQTNTAVTAIRQLGAATNLITLNQLDETVALIYRGGAWRLADNLSYIEPIYFSGTNAAANAAASRTNLGLGVGQTVEFDELQFLTLVDSNYSNYIKYDSSGVFSYTTDGGGFTSKLIDFTTDPFNQNAQEALFYAPIRFTTNSANLAGSQTNDPAGITRTNLGLGATNNVSFSNVTASGTLTATGTVTATTNLVVNGFVDFSTNHTNVAPATNNQIQKFLQIRIGTNAFFLPLYK